MSNDRRENEIERLATAIRNAGYDGGPVIVYRDMARVGLALAFIAAANPDTKGRISGNLDWCVIGTRDMNENRRIREGVNRLAAQIGLPSLG